MRDQNQPLDFYDILGVSANASEDEIRRAYRQEALRWHPDRNNDSDAPRMMQFINQAWEVLGDRERRAEYDRERERRARSGQYQDPMEEFRENILNWLLARGIDLYDILDVPINATLEEVDRSFIYIRQRIEGDRSLAGDPAASAFLRLVNVAHFVLSNPEYRAEYDRHYFLMRSQMAEQARRQQEEERREFERQDEARRQEQARREAEAQRRREEAERRRQQPEREARERRIREEHQRREWERLRKEARSAERSNHLALTLIAILIVSAVFFLFWQNRDDSPPASESTRLRVVATRTPRPSLPPPRPTATPVPRVVAAPAAKPTSSPIVKPTATIVPNPTATRTPKPTPTRIPTSAPNRTSVPIQPRNNETSVAYGPRNGTLINGSDSGWWFDSNTDFRDFLAEVVFTIPQIIVGDYWIGGIIIRANGSEADLVGIVSNGEWFHARQSGISDEWETVDQGYSSAIKTEARANNRVQIAASGEAGWLSINGSAPIDLDFDGTAQSGSVVVVSDADLGTSPTSFSGFTVKPVTSDQQSTTVLTSMPTPVPTPAPKQTSTGNSSGSQTANSPTGTPDPTRTSSSTILHALLMQHPDFVTQVKVNALIRSGVDVNAQNGDGKTPLDIAVEDGHLSVVIDALVDGGAVSSDPSTILHALFRMDHDLVTQVKVNALIKSGADINARDAQGRTPLDIAVEDGHLSVVIDALVNGGAVSSDPTNR